MRILFTNQRVNRIGGSQGIVRDLAIGLRNRGHTVLVFCSVEPTRQDSLADESIPITSSLESLPFVPDVIHAQHHLEAMMALLALPGVPAVYCCHGATRLERQLKHPRILRYVAMSPTLRLRMAIESGIDESRIDVIYNAVDLRRFRVVRNPPDRPRRALVYSRGFDPDSRIGHEIRKAAALTGLSLEYRGIGTRLTPIPTPEETLPTYDIVFTSGKSAIDALASGCAVIVAGHTSCGEIVSETNFDRLRRANFSPPVNSPPPSAERIADQIALYSADRVASTSRRLREVANVEAYVDQFASVYEKVIDTRGRSVTDPGAERKSAAPYLRSLAPWASLLDDRRTGRREPSTVSGLRAGVLLQAQRTR